MKPPTDPHDLDRLPGMPGAKHQSPARRRVPIWLIIALLVVALPLGAFLIYLVLPLSAPLPEDVGAAYAGIEQGTTDEGFPRLGNPNAPVVVEEFSSYACPHCRTFHEEWFPALLKPIAAGQVQFVYIPVTTIGQGAGSAAKAALCAGEQGRYWAMHDALFYWQNRFLVTAFSGRRLKLGAENLGLDVNAFEQCMDQDRPGPVLARAQDEFERRGLRGTPSLFINGQPVQDYRELEKLGQPAEGSAEGTS